VFDPLTGDAVVEGSLFGHTNGAVVPAKLWRKHPEAKYFWSHLVFEVDYCVKVFLLLFFLLLHFL
jgi:hypothetical protein